MHGINGVVEAEGVANGGHDAAVGQVFAKTVYERVVLGIDEHREPLFDEW